jgi:hypothetical protein
MEVRSTAAAGRGMFALAASPEGSLVFETAPFSSAILPEFASRTCPMCFQYQGPRGPRQPVAGNFCSEACAAAAEYIPGYSVGVKWIAALREAISARKRRAAKMGARAAAGPAGAPRASDWDAGDQPWSEVFVPSDMDACSCCLAVMALARWWACDGADASHRPRTTCPPAGDSGFTVPSELQDASVADMLRMQNNEAAAMSALGARGADLVACYWLLRGVQRRARAPPILGADSTRFRAVLFRERANSFGIWEAGSDDPQTPGFEERDLLGIALYPLATFFNHSCRPNLYKASSPGIRGAARFMALREISVGDELTIGYCGLRDTLAERQEFLLQNYFFVCACFRCEAEKKAESSALPFVFRDRLCLSPLCLTGEE